MLQSAGLPPLCLYIIFFILFSICHWSSYLLWYSQFFDQIMSYLVGYDQETKEEMKLLYFCCKSNLKIQTSINIMSMLQVSEFQISQSFEFTVLPWPCLPLLGYLLWVRVSLYSLSTVWVTECPVSYPVVSAECLIILCNWVFDILPTFKPCVQPFNITECLSAKWILLL